MWYGLQKLSIVTFRIIQNPLRIKVSKLGRWWIAKIKKTAEHIWKPKKISYIQEFLGCIRYISGYLLKSNRGLGPASGAHFHYVFPWKCSSNNTHLAKFQHQAPFTSQAYTMSLNSSLDTWWRYKLQSAPPLNQHWPTGERN